MNKQQDKWVNESQNYNKWSQLCIDLLHFSIIQMNPSLGTSAQDKSGTVPHLYATQPPLIAPNPPYRINVNAPSHSTPNPSQSTYRQTSKAQDDLNHHSKTAFTTTPTIPKTPNGFSALSSYARPVKEAVDQKEKPDAQNSTSFNDMDKYANTYSKYSGQGGKEHKMASSAIFPNSNQQFQFNRFPAFNLGWNQAAQPSNSTSSTSSTSSDGGVKTSQSAKEKRDRQLMEIKKQLDELNKKMVMNAQKNKTNAFSNIHPQELRPAKSSAVSHSAIFQPIPSQSLSHQGSEPKSAGFQSASIEQLYLQKKQNQSAKEYVGKESFLPTKQIKGPSYQQKIGNYSDWQNSHSTKTNEGEKTTEEAKLTVGQASSNPTPKPQPTKAYKYDYATSSSNLGYEYTANFPVRTNKAEGYYANNYSNPQGDKPAGQSFPQTKPFSSTPPPVQIKAPIYSFSKTSQSPEIKPPAYSPAKIEEPNHSVTEMLVQKRQASEAGGFKKKKGPAADYAEQKIDMKQAVAYPETSTSASSSAHNNYSHLKRTESLDYEDPSIPLPELRQFKISDFAMGKKMGKGQFGSVMLVRHKETGWVCGLKVMDKKQIRDQDYAGQIARQLSIQFYLSHRNIAQLYGYFADEKNFYLLIEFCTGGQLLQKLKQEHRMSERDVSIIIRQVCQGLDYIHKQLIIHRDIKPENILFNHQVAKICDFGWAVYRGFGMRKTASGSPLYYPPEIVKGESYDDKIDIWCIGMMTYECILGKIPFRVYTEMDLGRIVSDQITFPSWVDVTDEAKDFILKTLKKKGQERMEIKQILRHPFITKHQEKQLSPSILQEFRRVLV